MALLMESIRERLSGSDSDLYQAVPVPNPRAGMSFPVASLMEGTVAAAIVRDVGVGCGDVGVELSDGGGGGDGGSWWGSSNIWRDGNLELLPALVVLVASDDAIVGKVVSSGTFVRGVAGIGIAGSRKASLSLLEQCHYSVTPLFPGCIVMPARRSSAPHPRL